MSVEPYITIGLCIILIGAFVYIKFESLRFHLEVEKENNCDKNPPEWLLIILYFTGLLACDIITLAALASVFHLQDELYKWLILFF